MWFSKHMEGPTTLAAPLQILNAKKLPGQGLLRPHLFFTTAGGGDRSALVAAAQKGAWKEGRGRACEQAQFPAPRPPPGADGPPALCSHRAPPSPSKTQDAGFVSGPPPHSRICFWALQHSARCSAGTVPLNGVE